MSSSLSCRRLRYVFLRALSCAAFFSISFSFLAVSSADAKEFVARAPTRQEVIAAILDVSSQTNVRAALLYGLLGQETGQGTNFGKTESQWEAVCRFSNTRTCQKWRFDDCKAHYENARHYDDILRLLGFVDAFGRADRSQIPTSFTCALGFTQFEPNTWWGTMRSRTEKTLDPWKLKDALLMAAWYLEDAGADATQRLGPSEIIGPRDRIALQKYYCGGFFARQACVDYADEVAAKAAAAPLELLTEDQKLRIRRLQEDRSRFQPPKQPAPPPIPPKKPEIPALTITTASLPQAIFGIAYSGAPLRAAGGILPYTWTIAKNEGDGLPAGLSLEPQLGVILGTPKLKGVTGYFSFRVIVTDRNGAQASKWFSLFVEKKEVLITTTALPNGVKGRFYEFRFSAAEGVPPYAWRAVADQGDGLPQALEIEEKTGLLVGTPVKSRHFNFLVELNDNAGAKDSKWFSIFVEQIPVAITTEKLKEATLKLPYSETLFADGGIAPYAWSILPYKSIVQIEKEGGLVTEERELSFLPQGLALDRLTGIISGTPGKPGFFNVLVEVRDSVETISTKWLSMSVKELRVNITTRAIPEGTVRVPYGVTFFADGGIPPYTWRVASGDPLPQGLSLDPLTGIISGTPEIPRFSNFTLEVKDSVGITGIRSFSLNAKEIPVFITSRVLANALVQQYYSETLFADGGIAPYAWSIDPEGILPAGLALEKETGIISGAPTSSGTWNFTVKVTDTVGTVNKRALFISVENPPPPPSPQPPLPPPAPPSESATSPASSFQSFRTAHMTGVIGSFLEKIGRIFQSVR